MLGMHKSIERTEGQSAVEFALSIPILVMLLIGILDLGRGIHYYNTISYLAREGARTGIVLKTTTDWGTAGNSPGTYSAPAVYSGTNTIVGKIASEAKTLDLAATRVTISAPAGTNRYLELPLAVRVDYGFSPLYANWIGSAGTITLTAQATMRIE
jgi:Flp pilus assembly protein TadG